MNINVLLSLTVKIYSVAYWYLTPTTKSHWGQDTSDPSFISVQLNEAQDSYERLKVYQTLNNAINLLICPKARISWQGLKNKNMFIWNAFRDMSVWCEVV